MASLAEALYTLPSERLRALIEARDVALNKLTLTPGKRQLVQYLAAELSRPASILAAIQDCTVRELRLLQLLVSADTGSHVPWNLVLEAAGGPELESVLLPVVTGLEDHGLAFRMGHALFLPDAVKSHVPISLPDRHSLARCLSALDVPALKRIYQNLELGGPPGVKAEIIEAIRAHLLDGHPGLRLKTPLDAGEVAVLEYLVSVGGWAAASDVAVGLEMGVEDFFRYDWQNRWKQGRERNAIDTLLARGILFVVAHGYAYNLFLVIPGDLLRALTGDASAAFWTRPAPAPTPLPAPPASVAKREGLLRDVVGLFAALIVQEPARTSTGHIHKAALKAIARGLSIPDERYASFVYALCREAKWIEPQGEKMTYALTARGETWLRADPLSQMRALFEAWRRGTAWAEMCNDPLIRNDSYRSEENITQMRQAMLSLIASGPANSFIDIASLTDALTFRSPLLLAQSAYMAYDLVSTPSIFARRLVSECLFWLGLAELGFPEEASALRLRAEEGKEKKTGRGKPAQPPPLPEAAAYRLTPLGACLLGAPGAEASGVEEPREEKFIIQANAEIFVPPYLDSVALYQLLTLTDPPAKDSVGSGARLTRDSIRRALDRGMTQREIISFLQSGGRTGIPQNIEYLINEVADRHGHIHLGKAEFYVQTDSPLLLQELQARKELKPYFARMLTDTVALLHGEDTEKLLRELRKAGYLPVSDDAPRSRKVSHKPADASSLLASLAEPKSRSKKAGIALDWNRIAQEDGKPWHAGGGRQTAEPAEARPAGAAPPGAVAGRPAILKLLTQAIRQKLCVEIAYRPTNASGSVAQTIEPRVLLGDYISAFNRAANSHQSYQMQRIQWANLTGESFTD